MGERGKAPLGGKREDSFLPSLYNPTPPPFFFPSSQSPTPALSTPATRARSSIAIFFLFWLLDGNVQATFGVNTNRGITKLSQILLALRVVKLSITILKYHSWYLCQISLQIVLLPIQINLLITFTQ